MPSAKLSVMRTTEMQIGLTRRQCCAFSAMFVAGMFVGLIPHFGPPHFRYTGSDPGHHVWNFGWPLATFIYDAAQAPYFFRGPVAYLYAFVAAFGGTLLWATMVVWNNRDMLRGSPEIESKLLDRHR